MDMKELLKRAALGDKHAIRILVERGVLHESTLKAA